MVQREDGGIPLPRASNTGGVPRIPEPQVQLQPRQKKRVPPRGTGVKPASDQICPQYPGLSSLAETETEAADLSLSRQEHIFSQVYAHALILLRKFFRDKSRSAREEGVAGVL